MPTKQECWNEFWVAIAHVHAANLRRQHAHTTEITTALATLREPSMPVDGDCLHFEPFDHRVASP